MAGCIPIPTWPVPTLPANVSLPTFSPPTLPDLGLCCKISLPSFPVPNLALTIPFPAGVIATLDAFLQGVQAYFDQLGPTCPRE